MPKVKTHSGAKKRFIITASGKVKRKQAFKNHILDCKSKKQKRHLTSKVMLDPGDMPRVRKMLNI